MICTGALLQRSLSSETITGFRNAKRLCVRKPDWPHGVDALKRAGFVYLRFPYLSKAIGIKLGEAFAI